MQLRQFRLRRFTFKVKSFGVWLALAGLGMAAVGLGQLILGTSLDLPWQGWLTLATITATFLANALTNLPAEVVFLGGLAILLITGILDTDTALAGFSNAGMITVGVLYGNRDEDDLGRSRQDFLSVMLSVKVPLYSGSRQDRQVIHAPVVRTMRGKGTVLKREAKSSGMPWPPLALCTPAATRT